MTDSPSQSLTRLQKAALWLVKLFFNAVVAGAVGALIVGFILQRAAEVAEVRQESSIALNRAAVLARDLSDPQVELRPAIRQRFEEALDEDFFLLRGRLPENLHDCLAVLVNRTRLRDERIVDIAAWQRAFDEDSAAYSEWVARWAKRSTRVPFLANPWEERECPFA